MAQNSYYVLTIVISGNATHFYGTEEVLLDAISKWDDWINDIAKADDAIMEIHTITNTIDRAALSTVIKMDLIQSMSMCSF